MNKTLNPKFHIKCILYNCFFFYLITMMLRVTEKIVANTRSQYVKYFNYTQNAHSLKKISF